MQYILVNGSDSSSSSSSSSSEREDTAAADSRALVTIVGSPSPQHRRHPRTRASGLLVKIRVGAGFLVQGVEDISLGGLFARSSRELPRGTAVELALLRAGHDELPLLAVVVSEGRRGGLALRFEGVASGAQGALRQLVAEQRTRAVVEFADAASEPAARTLQSSTADRAVDELRQRLASLQGENERLRVEVAAGHEAQRLAGRLQVELDRLRSRIDGDVVVDCEALASVQRDVETAWVAVARVADAITRLR
jgi:uncharacterized small protein (DUF1192 family)